MLVALLKSKLDRELKRPAVEIEDLLTALVFGTVQYVDPEKALLPFLGAARDQNNRRLREELTDVTSVSYEFWPSWRSSPTRDKDTSNAADQSHDGGIPELLLVLERTDRAPAWILVEAKLLSGKSSRPTAGTDRVTDQLGKYWLEMKRLAATSARNPEPLAVVYVTRGSLVPSDDLEETQCELLEKGHQRAPLFWLSWGHFISECSPTSVPIVVDVIKLLREIWHLEHVSVRDWPQLPARLPAWTFTDDWPWPSAPLERCAWRFSDHGDRP